MTELRNCRWCHSTDLHIEEFYVGCLSCGAIGPSAESKEEAIKAWNSRTPDKLINVVYEGTAPGAKLILQEEG